MPGPADTLTKIPPGFQFPDIGNGRKRRRGPKKARQTSQNVFPSQEVRAYVRKFKSEFVKRKEFEPRMGYLRSKILPDTFNWLLEGGTQSFGVEELREMSTVCFILDERSGK